MELENSRSFPAPFSDDGLRHIIYLLTISKDTRARMAREMMNTKSTGNRQATVPKDIRDLLGVAGGARVHLSTTVAMPMEVSSDSDLKRRLDEAEADLAMGRVRDARNVSAGIRERYHV